jgi:hypothetical protein
MYGRPFLSFSSRDQIASFDNNAMLILFSTRKRSLSCDSIVSPGSLLLGCTGIRSREDDIPSSHELPGPRVDEGASLPSVPKRPVLVAANTAATTAANQVVATAANPSFTTAANSAATTAASPAATPTTYLAATSTMEANSAATLAANPAASLAADPAASPAAIPAAATEKTTPAVIAPSTYPSLNLFDFVDVRMIDFAHSTHCGLKDSTLHEGPDRGFLFGLDSFISILDELAH